MRKLFLIACTLFSLSAYSQVSLDYYLPTNVNYNPSIPTPSSVIGHEVGEWHITHDRLVYYMKALAEASDRVSFEVYGYSHEKRPLVLLTITSPDNHKNIDQIKEQHKKLISDPDGSHDIGNMPTVIWMGYSVHGNEPSGSNASMLTAYYLAAAEDAATQKKLSETVVLIDPSINPDGLHRFSTWVNSNRSTHAISNPDSREHNEFWPRGRTNHYMFDINRDWLLVQQPETQGRLEKFYEWRPNILTDHHEMGSNNTFFFQPGIPSRNNPLTPSSTVEMTGKIGEFHAHALDSIGSLYYTEESFDDFYFGKGSTYPDINGGIGILFEQASSRGHKRETDNGLLTFPFTIRNQFNTSLSTFEAGFRLREELLNHQKNFYSSAKKEASSDQIKGYVYGESTDHVRLEKFNEILTKHRIQFFELENNVTVNGKSFKEGKSYLVPLEQTQYRLIKSLFEQRTTFTDSTFYDVSAWTLPLAFNLNFTPVNSKDLSRIKYLETPIEKMIIGPEKSDYAYLFEWHEYNTPKLLYKLQEKGYITKVTTHELRSNGTSFARGSILVPVQIQKKSSDELHKDIQELSQSTEVVVYSIKSGYTQGVKLGSPTIHTIKKPKILLVVEEGVSSYEAGEIWHLLDYRYEIPVSLVPVRILNRIDLEDYTTIIMVSGGYSNFPTGKVKNWIMGGGTLLATRNALRWVESNKLAKLNLKKIERDTNDVELLYETIERRRGAQLISGAIFENRLDLTHPLCYGYTSTRLPIFRNSKIIMDKTDNPYAHPVMYTDNPLMAGYISEENHERVRSSTGVGVFGLGRGHIIAYADNPNFRSFWVGTNKLLMNGIFFSEIIRLR